MKILIKAYHDHKYYIPFLRLFGTLKHPVFQMVSKFYNIVNLLVNDRDLADVKHVRVIEH